MVIGRSSGGSIGTGPPRKVRSVEISRGSRCRRAAAVNRSREGVTARTCRTRELRAGRDLSIENYSRRSWRRIINGETQLRNYVVVPDDPNGRRRGRNGAARLSVNRARARFSSRRAAQARRGENAAARALSGTSRLRRKLLLSGVEN